MTDEDLEEALVLQGRIAAFVRAFGLHQPDRTPCGILVPVSEAHAVGELDRDGPLSQGELAGRLRLEKSSVSRLVAQLIGRDWVRRIKHDGDARVVRLELTPAGSRVAGELAVARAARFADLLRNIPAERRAAVLDAIATLVDAAARQPAPAGEARG